MVALNLLASFESLAEGTNADLDPGISIGAGGTEPIAMGASAIRGTKGVRFSGAGVSSFLSQSIPTGQTVAISSHYFKVTSTPPASALDLELIRNATANMVNARLSTTNTFVVNDAGGAAKLGPTGVLPPGNYRIALAVTMGTTTADGRLGAWLRNADTGAFVLPAVDLSGVNTGTTEPSVVRHGKTGATGTITLDSDELGTGWGIFGEADFAPLSAANALLLTEAGAGLQLETGTFLFLG